MVNYRKKDAEGNIRTPAEMAEIVRAELAQLEAAGEGSYAEEMRKKDEAHAKAKAFWRENFKRAVARPNRSGRPRAQELGVPSSLIPRCGADIVDGSGRTCKRPAGYGTDHFGSGRCKYHFGNTGYAVMKTGKHSRYIDRLPSPLAAVVEHYCDDADPLNMESDIALLRALVEQWINEYDRWYDAVTAWHESYQEGDVSAKPAKVLELTDAYKLLDSLGKMVEREYKRRQSGMISQINLFRIVNHIGLVVEKHVHDKDALMAIREEMLEIRLPVAVEGTT